MPFRRGNRYGGTKYGARRSRGPAVRTPTPQTEHDVEDEDMVDGEDDEDGATPRQQADDDEEDAATPAVNDEEDDEDAPPTITTLPRRRGGRARGSGQRSLRTERMDYGTPALDDNDVSESGTPYRRRRGRPPGPASARGRGGFRGRRRGQRPEPPQSVIDKDGNALEVVDDEVLVDGDEEGDAKVDSKGVLQGGREYRVRTFTIIGRDDRLYMLSTEPARCCGFRDSYLFFAKHPKLFKVLLGDTEKLDLIDRDILPNSYKGRNIGVVTARSVFREFGARIIVGGRKIIDDYKVAEARANGDIEGELADVDDRVPDNKVDYNRNRYVAWFGASEVYRIQAGGTMQTGKPKPGPVGKRRTNITVTNWQHLHAREASRFNTSLTALRRANIDGIYDTHTNLMFYPKIMQPTHARWEQIPPPLAAAPSGIKELTNGITSADTDHADGDDMEIEDLPPHAKSAATIFSEIPAIVSRNFAVIDTVYTAPSISHTGYPGPDGFITDPTSGPNGLTSIPDDIVDELPNDCRRAFEEARRTEVAWKRQWGTEAQSGMRGALKVGFNGYPV